MITIKIINGRIYSPDFQFHKGNLMIENGYITEIEYSKEDVTSKTEYSEKEVTAKIDYSKEVTLSANTSQTSKIDYCIEPSIDAEDCYVIPGLIDIHFHGCMGYDFCDGTLDSLTTIARQEAAWGITGICPASMTLPPEKLSSIMKNAHDYYLLQHICKYNNDGCKNNSAELTGADLLGINMEGPFLSFSKRGAQNAKFLRKPDIMLYRQLQEFSGGLIKLVDVAPEAEGALDFIRQASDSCVISLAHTAADYHTCREAFHAGASHVTHLFNAMNAFSHREPGLPGAAFDTPDCNVELICDGIHLSPAAIRMVFQLFTDERIILISDSMMATGMPDGSYTLGGQSVTVRGSLATLTANTTVDSTAPQTCNTIAGSVTHLADCVRKAVSFGIPLESAIRCTTANPAKSIGCDGKYGYLKPRYVANVVILNSDLSIRNVILRGKQIV